MIVQKLEAQRRRFKSHSKDSEQSSKESPRVEQSNHRAAVKDALSKGEKNYGMDDSPQVIRKKSRTNTWVLADQSHS